MQKNKLYDFLLIFFVFLFCASFPIDLIVKNNALICSVVKLCLLIAFLIFFLIYKKKTSLNFKPNTFNVKNFLILLPVFLACGSNFSNFLFGNATYQNTANETFIVTVLLTLMTAIDEEIVFRYVFEGNLKTENKLYRILIAAGVFGLSHITIFLSTFNPVSLVNIIYTFAVGLVLGFIYEYVGCLYACMFFHFLFNLFNSNLFEAIASCELNFTYYLCNIGVGTIVGIYVLLIYLFVLKKQDA